MKLSGFFFIIENTRKIFKFNLVLLLVLEVKCKTLYYNSLQFHNCIGQLWHRPRLGVVRKGLNSPH